MKNYFSILSNIAEHNKYYTWYLGICQEAQKRGLTKQSNQIMEKHHIIPRSFGLGGETDKLNLVMLTPREHYISHMLLTKMFNKNILYKKKMIYALWRLSNRGLLYIPNSRKYNFAKKEMISLIKLRKDSKETRLKKARPGTLNGMYGKTHTTEVKQRLSALRKKELTGKTYEELYGVKKAEQIKKDRSNKLKEYIKNNPGIRAGNNNGRAKSTILTSPEGVEFYICGTLNEFCKEHNLSHGSFKNSLYSGKEIKGKNSGWKIRWA